MLLKSVHVTAFNRWSVYLKCTIYSISVVPCSLRPLGNLQVVFVCTLTQSQLLTDSGDAQVTIYCYCSGSGTSYVYVVWEDQSADEYCRIVL